MSEQSAAAGRNATYVAQSRQSSASVPACLGCRTEGGLTKASVVVREGRYEVDIRERVGVSVYGLPATVRGRAVRVSALAKALAPPRLPRSDRKPVLLAGAVGLAVVVGMTRSSRPGVELLGWLLFAGLVVGSIALFRERSPGAASTSGTGRRARWLWHRCWYCRRCGAVSLFTRNGSRKLGVKNLAGVLLDLAERLRWPEDEDPAPA